MRKLLPISFILLGVFMFFFGVYISNQKNKKWYDNGLMVTSYGLALVFIVLGIGKFKTGIE